MTDLIPFNGTAHITRDPSLALRCVHCHLFDPDEPSIITIEPVRDETTCEVPDGPQLTNSSTIHVLHINCYVNYHVANELQLLRKIELPPHVTIDQADMPQVLLMYHDYLRQVGLLYATVDGIKFYCVAAQTSPNNPSYRCKVPMLPSATPILDKKLWSPRMYQHLFSVMHLVDVEVTLRNHNHSTNFATLVNQVQTFFAGFAAELQGVYTWWHDIKQTSRDRRYFRIVFLHRPPLVDTTPFVHRTDTTWSDFLGEQLDNTSSIGHHVQSFQHIAQELTNSTTVALVNRFSDSEDYNVKLSDTPITVPFTAVIPIQSSDIGCVFNAQYEPNKNRVRCCVIETKPHPTIIPFQGGCAQWMPVSFDTMREFNLEHSSLHDPPPLLPTESLLQCTTNV